MDLISANHGWCLSVSLPFWSWLKYLSLHHVLGKHWILIGSSSQTVFSVLNGCRHLDIKNKLPTLSVVKYRLFVSNHRYIWRELLPFVSRGHWNLPRYVERCREGNSDLRLSFFLLLTKNAICGKTEFHPTYRLNYFTFVVTSWIKRGNNDFSWEWVKWCRWSRPAVNLRRYLCGSIDVFMSFLYANWISPLRLWSLCLLVPINTPPCIIAAFIALALPSLT